MLTETQVTHAGEFHQITATTSLPRPTQKPRPKFYVAATTTVDTFEYAGTQGYSIMAIPMAGGKVRDLIGRYRAAWRKAGHPGDGEVMLAFHMFCDTNGDRARSIARGPLTDYLNSLVDAAGDWSTESSADYPGYDKMIAALKAETMESLIASGSAWIGTPAEIVAGIRRIQADSGGFEHASMQVNFGTIPGVAAQGSIKLFAEAAIPQFKGG